MEYLCPICGNKLVTEDLNIYTCINCEEIFTIEEINEEYGFETSCNGNCAIKH